MALIFHLDARYGYTDQVSQIAADVITVPIISDGRGIYFSGRQTGQLKFTSSIDFSCTNDFVFETLVFKGTYPQNVNQMMTLFENAGYSSSTVDTLCFFINGRSGLVYTIAYADSLSTTGLQYVNVSNMQGVQSIPKHIMFHLEGLINTVSIYIDGVLVHRRVFASPLKMPNVGYKKSFGYVSNSTAMEYGNIYYLKAYDSPQNPVYLYKNSLNRKNISYKKQIYY